MELVTEKVFVSRSEKQVSSAHGIYESFDDFDYYSESTRPNTL